MTSWEPTYEWYAGEHGGTASEECFDEQLQDALAYVGWRIGRNEVTAATADACRHAVCACVDELREGAGSAGVSIGSFSYGALSSDRESGGDPLGEACDRWLATTGLLWRGL